MKSRVKKIISCIMAVLLTVCILARLTDLLERKTSDYKYAPFFEEEENFDVLFYGSSHMMNAVFPMELWKDYGIVSYNCAGHGNQIATSYWVMENTLDYTSPKLMVIDCFQLGENLKTTPDFSLVHLSLDAFPLSRTKLASINDLLDDSEWEKVKHKYTNKEERTKIGLIWDYSVYHARWNEFNRQDILVSSTEEKGAESKISVTEPEEILKSTDEMLTEDTVGVEYLKRMIEDCQSRNIDVLLTYLPFPATADNWLDSNRVEEIAKEYNVNYINFLKEDIVDYNTDCYDSFSHLNPSGAKKVTDYIGSYIKDNYDIPDQRNNEAYQSWKTDYEAYKALKDSYFTGEQGLANYLMLLKDKEYKAVIELNEEIFEDATYTALLNNIGITREAYTVNPDSLILVSGGEVVSYSKEIKCSDNIFTAGDGSNTDGIRIELMNMDDSHVDTVRFAKGSYSRQAE